MGEVVLLDVIPIEDMDFVVVPAKLNVTVNPESLNIPSSAANQEKNKPNTDL